MCIVKPDIIDLENNAEYYIGTISDPLSYQNVQCNPSRDCYIQCTDTSACVQTYVECSSPKCIIQCSGSLSCEKMQIKSINSPITTLSCTENFACLNATLSVIADNSITNQATISCTKTDSCHETLIYSNTNTRFQCGTGQFSCRYTKVYVNSGTANNILTDYECKRGHNTCSHTELHVTGSGTGNAVQVYCGSSSGSSGDNCQYVYVYCDINGYNCDVTGGNPYYSSLGSKIFCRGGQGTTCTHWDGGNRWFQYATWTPYPTPVITPIPTAATLSPTYCPTTDPTTDPTQDPTKDPTHDPTHDPTTDPTFDPTADPTTDPSLDPTTDPTYDPTVDPTTDPTNDPTTYPTYDPTKDPTTDPTNDPTKDPTTDPTYDPTTNPTNDPTADPTKDPTKDPTTDPTFDPTTDPTNDPTIDPTTDPTNDPTTDPTIDPTTDPTTDPTIAPTMAPSLTPSLNPSLAPSVAPTMAPSLAPSLNPSLAPSVAPSISPSISPTLAPSFAPTSMPTPTCHCAKFKGEMIVSSNMNRNDILWGGESFVSYNCRYLLKMKKNGNIIFKHLVGNFINPFEKDQYGNYIRDSNDRCAQKISRYGWEIGWNTSTLIANYSGEAIPKLMLQDGSLVVYEEQFKNVPGMKAILLWRSNDAKNGKDMILRLTDEACLMLHKYGQNAKVETAIWYKCLAVENDDTDTDITTTFITSFYDSGSHDDDAFGGANTNGNISASSWWIWVVIILLFLCFFIIFICFRRYSHNKKLISNIAITSVELSDDMDPEIEGYKDNDMETTQQIEQWFVETNNTNTTVTMPSGEFMIEMQHTNEPTVMSN